jgi:hypothetical protein
MVSLHKNLQHTYCTQFLTSHACYKFRTSWRFFTLCSTPYDIHRASLEVPITQSERQCDMVHYKESRNRKQRQSWWLTFFSLCYHNMQSGWWHQHFEGTYCCHTSVIPRKVGMALGAFQQKMLRVIYGPIQENTLWSIQYNMTSSS